MLKIQVLGKGMIPRGYGLAPRKEPFYADLTLIATIIQTNGLTVNYVNPETGELKPLTRTNLTTIYKKYENYRPSEKKEVIAPSTPVSTDNTPVETNESTVHVAAIGDGSQSAKTTIANVIDIAAETKSTGLNSIVNNSTGIAIDKSGVSPVQQPEKVEEKTDTTPTDAAVDKALSALSTIANTSTTVDENTTENESNEAESKDATSETKAENKNNNNNKYNNKYNNKH